MRAPAVANHCSKQKASRTCGAVAEVLAEAGVSARLVRLAIPGTPAAAPVDILMSGYGFDAEGIAASVRKALTG